MGWGRAYSDTFPCEKDPLGVSSVIAHGWCEKVKKMRLTVGPDAYMRVFYGR